jgi:hypothetical protein
MKGYWEGRNVSRGFCRKRRREKATLRLSRKVPDLATLTERIVKGEGIEESELRSGMRKKRVVRGRRIFCQLAVGKMGHPGAEVARYLGVTTASANRLAVSQEVVNLERYLNVF